MAQSAKTKAFIEALKEVGRLALIAAVSAALVAVQSFVTGLEDQTANIILGGVIGLAIKAVDKYRYKKTKEDATVKTTGLLPF